MSLRIIGNNIAIHKGDSGVVEVQVFEDEDLTTPTNLTGYSAHFVVGDDFGETFANLILNKDTGALGGVVITDPAQGKYQIQFSKAWTSGLAVKPYAYSTKVVSPGGSPYTIFAGRFDLMQNLPHE